MKNFELKIVCSLQSGMGSHFANGIHAVKLWVHLSLIIKTEVKNKKEWGVFWELFGVDIVLAVLCSCHHWAIKERNSCNNQILESK